MLPAMFFLLPKASVRLLQTNPFRISETDPLLLGRGQKCSNHVQIDTLE
jgi:hypothetical protein